MITNFNNVANFYETFLKKRNIFNPQTQQQFYSDIAFAKKVLEKSENNLSNFFSIINGKKQDVSTMKTMCFPNRFYKEKIGPKKMMKLDEIIRNCFFVGYIFHFIHMRYPTREKINEVDYNKLFNEWIPKTIIADVVMNEYNRTNNELPSRYLDVFYKEVHNYDRIFKNIFGIWFWNRPKIYSFMRNIMYCGAYYGMLFDLATGIDFATDKFDENNQYIIDDDIEAIKLMAIQGDEYAQYKLGDKYRKGQGVTQDFEESIKWYRKSAEQGNAGAQYNLGCMYDGQLYKQDFVESAKWFKKSAEQGDAGAQYSLGNMYRLGQGVKQDLVEALKWYRKSADQGNSFGQYNLGCMYCSGIGVEQSYILAYAWFGVVIDYSVENDLRENAIGTRAEIENILTIEQISEAKKITKELKSMVKS